MTIAEEYIEDAKNLIRAAFQSLSKIVIEECPGYDNFPVDYQRRLADTLHSLIQMRKDLGERI